MEFLVLDVVTLAVLYIMRIKLIRSIKLKIERVHFVIHDIACDPGWQLVC